MKNGYFMLEFSINASLIGSGPMLDRVNGACVARDLCPAQCAHSEFSTRIDARRNERRDRHSQQFQLIARIHSKATDQPFRGLEVRAKVVIANRASATIRNNNA